MRCPRSGFALNWPRLARRCATYDTVSVRESLCGTFKILIGHSVIAVVIEENPFAIFLAKKKIRRECVVLTRGTATVHAIDGLSFFFFERDIFFISLAYYCELICYYKCVNDCESLVSLKNLSMF